MIFIWMRRIIWFCILLGSLLTAAGCFYYYHTQSALPDVNELKDVTFETPLLIYTKDRKLIAEFGQHRRIPLAIHQIPERLKNAFLAIEDARFYEHVGIDPIGIVRAAYAGLSSGKKVQGASTITQQVARNFFLSNEKTFSRKIKEIFLSWKIEQTLTKDEILELYLNKIALGHHSYGVAAAAYVYFGKTVDELTLGEMAIIAGLPKAPSNLNPISNPDNAKKRRHLVLNRMLQLNMITPDEYQEADNEPVSAYYHTAKLEAYAPYVAESIRQKMENTYGEGVYTEGYKVYASIDSGTQHVANRAVYDGITAYDMRHGYRTPENILKTQNIDLNDEESLKKVLKPYKAFEYVSPAIAVAADSKTNAVTVYIKDKGPGTISYDHMKWAKNTRNDVKSGNFPAKVAQFIKPGDLVYVEHLKDNQYALRQIPAVQSALISLDSHTGAIKAMVGGYSFAQNTFNRVEQAKRQAGSNIKPFLYSAALADRFTLASLMLDERISIWNPWSKTSWSPKNSPNVYEGLIPIREALTKSKNVVSVRLIRALGVNKFVTHFTKFGFNVKKYQKNDSIALGAFEVSPLELVTGYATFSNGGYKIEPYLIDTVTLGDSEQIIYKAKPYDACKDCPNAVVNSIKPELIPEEAEQLVKGHHAEQIITHGNAFLIANTLHSVIWGGSGPRGRYNGTGTRARAMKRDDIAGKTGTTNESRDAWFSGFNGNTVTTVWVGFDNYAKSLGHGESGGKSALPIWIEFMNYALKGTEETPVEPGEDIITSNISGYKEFFIKDSNVAARTYVSEEEDFKVERPAGNGTPSHRNDTGDGGLDDIM